MTTIGVYRTDVENKVKAKELLELLRQYFPHCHASFDLEDCDNVLRVEGVGGGIDDSEIKKILKRQGHHAENLS